MKIITKSLRGTGSPIAATRAVRPDRPRVWKAASPLSMPIASKRSLFGMALLSMMVMGYQAGLTGTRSRLATWTLAVTFAAVMVLITDLDRPNMTLFRMDQGLMQELENRMDPYPSQNPGGARP
jgi:hypothetical protein